MSAEKSILVRRFFDEICNQRKLELADELFLASHTYHDPSSPWVGRGSEGVKQLISGYHRAFSDANWEIDEMIDAGDTVITRWTGHGTHDGDLMGITSTEKRHATKHEAQHNTVFDGASDWTGGIQQRT